MSRNAVTRRPDFFSSFFPPSTFFSPAMRDVPNGLEQFNARANELFRSAFGEPLELANQQFPALNVVEDKNEFTVTAELPGMSLKDIKVEYLDGVLTIEGQKEHEESKDEDGKSYHLWERRFGKFQRALPVPGGISDDRIKATYKDGVLTVRLPKTEDSKSKRRTVPITEK